MRYLQSPLRGKAARKVRLAGAGGTASVPVSASGNRQPRLTPSRRSPALCFQCIVLTVPNRHPRSPPGSQDPQKGIQSPPHPRPSFLQHEEGDGLSAPTELVGNFGVAMHTLTSVRIYLPILSFPPPLQSEGNSTYLTGLL